MKHFNAKETYDNNPYVHKYVDLWVEDSEFSDFVQPTNTGTAGQVPTKQPDGTTEWATPQVDSTIGELSDLHTDHKSTVVDAINELSDAIESEELVISMTQSNAERKVIYDLVKAHPHLVREMTLLYTDGLSYVVNGYRFDDISLTIHVIMKSDTGLTDVALTIASNGSISVM